MTTPQQWWARVGNVKRAMVLLSVFFGTLTASATAWPLIEPYVLAHRGYVRDYNDDQTAKTRSLLEPLRIGQLNQQISTAKARASAVEDRLITLEIEVAKSTDAEEKIRKQYQIRRLQEEFQEVDGETKRLIRERDKP